MTWKGANLRTLASRLIASVSVFSVKHYVINLKCIHLTPFLFFSIVLAVIGFASSAIAVTGMALTSYGMVKYDQIVYYQRSKLYSEYRIKIQDVKNEIEVVTNYFCGSPKISNETKRVSYVHNATTQYGKFESISFYIQSGTNVSFYIALEYNENEPATVTEPSEDVTFHFLNHDNFLKFRNGRGFDSLGSYTGKDSNFTVQVNGIQARGEYYAIVGAGIVESYIKGKNRKNANKWIYSEWKIDMNRTFLNTSSPYLRLNGNECSIIINGCEEPVAVVQASKDFNYEGPYPVTSLASVSAFMKFKTGHQFWIFGVPIFFCTAMFVGALMMAYKKMRDAEKSFVKRDLPSVISVCNQFTSQEVNGSYVDDGSILAFPTLDTPEDSMEQPLLLQAKEFGQTLDIAEKPVSGIGILSRSTSSSSLRGAYPTSPRSPNTRMSGSYSNSDSNSDSTSTSPSSVKKVLPVYPVGGTVSYSGMSSISPSSISPSGSHQFLSVSQKSFTIKTARDKRASRRKN